MDYLIPNLNLKIEFFDGKAVGVELPQTVELTVVETEPGLKSATATYNVGPILSTSPVAAAPQIIVPPSAVAVTSGQPAVFTVTGLFFK